MTYAKIAVSVKAHIEFIIQNVATGQYLNNEEPNN